MLMANDLMTEDPITVSMSARVADAVRLLETLEIRHLPVVDADGSLVGMLSDRDLRGLSYPAVVGNEYLVNAQTALEAPISSIMSSDVVSVELEADIAEIVEAMLERNVGAVPVVDADGSLVGIVSYVDILRNVAAEGEPIATTKRKAKHRRTHG
jgi:acetoin utilization protein AcuB